MDGCAGLLEEHCTRLRCASLDGGLGTLTRWFGSRVGLTGHCDVGCGMGMRGASVMGSERRREPGGRELGS